MSNQRTSNFKKKTATDTKQDEDISTLSTTVNTISAPTNLRVSNELKCGDNSSFTLKVNKTANLINSATGASLSGFNEISCSNTVSNTINCNNLNAILGISVPTGYVQCATLTTPSLDVLTTTEPTLYGQCRSLHNLADGSATMYVASGSSEQGSIYIGANNTNQQGNSNGFIYKNGASYEIANQDLVLQAGYDGTNTYLDNKIRFAYGVGTNPDITQFNKAISINNNGAIAFDASKTGNTITEGSYGSSGQVMASQGESLPPQWITIPTPSKSTLTFYVDGSCGADSNDGSREKPFRLIQSAINKCESIWDGVARNIQVAFGTYNENLVISKARIQLTGSVCSRYANVACGINGTITLQIADAVDMFNSQVFITGFQIVGSVIDASSSVHTLNIKDCYLYGQENIIQQRTRGAEYSSSRYTAVDCRTYLENLIINASNSNGTTPLVSIEAGNLEMTSCSITAKSANTNCIQLRANVSTTTFTSTTFTNDNSGDVLKSLFYLKYAYIGIPTLNTFANCGFIFSSGTPKTVNISNGDNSAIFSDGRDDYYNLLNCGFSLRGVSPTVGTNYAILPRYNNSANMYISQSGNVASFGTANKISYSGVSVVPFTAIEKALS